ncbi:hypothetical protein PHSY_004374 [Pseudozyma hubeiensis SY62]|uniref:Uncharacterized protein n=1 Tax=Pseudozyma hubeiensis (strain SY62) TaxID=1305764 RepID=R9PFD8_PSEHS|nr:hypothetical protein PHSY_004374 [Pseudozyma hubeiensis SY62]GAC96790.1 hypothetical protein PHSY_004374 [Pseudozyma hubeiensis SY62]
MYSVLCHTLRTEPSSPRRQFVLKAEAEFGELRWTLDHHTASTRFVHSHYHRLTRFSSEQHPSPHIATYPLRRIGSPLEVTDYDTSTTASLLRSQVPAMYSTSPSSSSMASSSGRSSPEHSSQQSASQTQRSNSFLLPQFFFAPTNNTNAAHNSETASHPVTNALLSQPPRRTSFGGAFSSSGRLSALSAFGFTSASPTLSSSPPATLAGAAELSKRTGSAVASPASESLPSWSTNPPAQQTNSSASTAAPAAPPAKRHLCFPDGMGGTVCVEVKDRSRRGSAVN